MKTIILLANIQYLITVLYMTSQKMDPLEECIYNVCNELADWIEYHSERVFSIRVTKQSPACALTKENSKDNDDVMITILVENSSGMHRLKEIVEEIAWNSEGIVNYIETAKRLLTVGHLSDTEKDRLMCLYCLEEEMKASRRSVDGTCDPMVLFSNYWSQGLKWKHNAWYVISPDDVIHSKSIDNQYAMEYFVNHLAYYQLLPTAKFIAHSYGHSKNQCIYLVCVLSRMDKSQLHFCLDMDGYSIIKALTSSLHSLQNVLKGWCCIKNFITNWQFSDFISGCVDSPVVFNAVWEDAPKSFKLFVLTSPRGMDGWCRIQNGLNDTNRVDRLIKFFPLLDVETREELISSSRIMEFCGKLLLGGKLSLIDRLMGGYQLEPAKFKINLVNSSLMKWYCLQQCYKLDSNKLKLILNDFLCDPQIIDDYMSDLLGIEAIIGACERVSDSFSVSLFVDFVSQFFTANGFHRWKLRFSDSMEAPKQSFKFCSKNLFKPLSEFFEVISLQESGIKYLMSILKNKEEIDWCFDMIIVKKHDVLDDMFECIARKSDSKEGEIIEIITKLKKELMECVPAKRYCLRLFQNFRNSEFDFTDSYVLKEIILYFLPNTTDLEDYFSELLSCDESSENPSFPPSQLVHTLNLFIDCFIYLITVSRIMMKKNIIMKLFQRHLLVRRCWEVILCCLQKFLFDEVELVDVIAQDFFSHLMHVRFSEYFSFLGADEMNKILIWISGGRQNLFKMKQKLPLFRIFVKMLEMSIFTVYCENELSRCEYKKNIEFSVLNEFLNWYFENPEDVEMYKMERIFNWEEIHVLRTVLRKKDAQHLEEILSWFFNKDEEAITTFKSIL